MSYFLYILGSRVKETYYISVRKDPEKRYFFHNRDSKGYTQKYRPWKVVFAKGFQTKKKRWLPNRK
jgi:predicted GIY-YIG superfamily endonuclease